MRNDQDLREDILAELRWEPKIDASQIEVAAREGVATLRGQVASFADKVAAGKAAHRVTGLRTLIDEISVSLPPNDGRDDAALTRLILAAIANHAKLAGQRITIQVEDGSVRLCGSVSWRFQREAAAKCITHIQGIRSISNLIEVHNPVSVLDVRDGIEAAFRRMADLDIGAVTVEVDGSRVMLRGTVGSLHEANVARQAAWSSPGVTDVDDQIEILG